MPAKKIIFATVLLAAGMSWQAKAQYQNTDVYESPGFDQRNYRYHINIPNLDGFITLKCDFHTHTAFSDGQVWPSMRVNEAWNDGLDAIAIGRYMYSIPVYANQVLRIDIPSGTEVTFTNCMIGQNKFATTKLM
jgi:hypothetical protein